MNKWSISVLLLLALVSSSAVASADNKTLPGSACVGFDGEGGYRPQTGQFLGQFNDTAYCPVIRDNTTTRITSVWVRLTDSTDASCLLQSANASESDKDKTDPIRQTGGSMRFDGTDLDHFSGGSYFVQCFFFGAGGIASIRWEEPNDSGTEFKLAPGLTCQSNIGNDVGSIDPLYGSFKSPSDVFDIPVSCPIFRDQDQGFVDLVDIRVDPGSGGAIRCWVLAQDGDSMVIDVTHDQVTSGGSNQLLSFDLDGLKQFGGSSYVVRCDVPALGEITNIKWKQ
jgi:hypothetical protein